MLVSPIRVHDILTGILETNEEDGPHTALLITPPGELISYSTLPEDIDGEESQGDAEEDDADGDGDGDGDDGDDDSDGDEEEPYLEGPERLRLLLGLASQWEDDESPRVECELGRLFLRPIPLPEQETTSASNLLPVVKPPAVNSFVLVLNGTASTPWSTLAQKADEFVANW